VLESSGASSPVLPDVDPLFPDVDPLFPDVDPLLPDVVPSGSLVPALGFPVDPDIVTPSV